MLQASPTSTATASSSVDQFNFDREMVKVEARVKDLANKVATTEKAIAKPTVDGFWD